MRKLIIGLGTVTVLMLLVLLHFELTKGKQESPVEVTSTPTITTTLEPTIEPMVTITPTETPTQEPKSSIEPIETVEPTNTPKPNEKPKNEQNTNPKETDKPKTTPSATVKPTAAPTKKPTSTPKPTNKPTKTTKPTVKPTVAPTPKPTKKPTDDMQLELGREMIEKAGFWKIIELPNGNYGMLVPNSSFEYSDKSVEMFRDYFDARDCDIDITNLHGGNWDDNGRYYYEFNKRGIYPR